MSKRLVTVDAAVDLTGLPSKELEQLVSAGVLEKQSGKFHPVTLVRGLITHFQNEPKRLNASPSVAELAAHLDMSQRNLRDVARGLNLDLKDTSLDVFRVAYIRDLREKAAGRGTSGEGSLVDERARLACAQAEKVEMENAEKRGELVNVGVLRDALADVSRQSVAIFEGIRAKLKRRFPDMSSDYMDLITDELNKARKLFVDIRYEPDESEDEKDQAA